MKGVKAKLAVNVWCPGGCGCVMTNDENGETCECRMPGCILRGKKFTVPKTEIELIEVREGATE